MAPTREAEVSLRNVCTKNRPTGVNERSSVKKFVRENLKRIIFECSNIRCSSSHKFPVPTVRLSRALKAILPRSIILWNDLPRDIKALTTFASFKAALQNHLKLQIHILLYLYLCFIFCFHFFYSFVIFISTFFCIYLYFYFHLSFLVFCYSCCCSYCFSYFLGESPD